MIEPDAVQEQDVTVETENGAYNLPAAFEVYRKSLSLT